MGVATQSGRHAKYRYYKCYNYSQNQECPDCARYVRVPRLDAEIWSKVWELLTSDKFERALEARIAELQAQGVDAEAECEKLKVRLNELGMEEQWVITQARKQTITEGQMAVQLAALAIERAELERDLNKARLMVGNQAGELIELARQYREHTATGLKGLNDEPINEEHARRQFVLRRKWVQGLVTRVDVAADKTPTVHVDVDLMKFAKPESDDSGNGSDTSQHAQRRKQPHHA